MARSRLAYLDGSISHAGKQTEEFAGITARWEGLVYIDGFLAQQESIRHWLKKVHQDGIDSAIPLLKGAFYMLLNTADGATHAFVDNSGMFPAYWSSRGSDMSYLTFVDSLGLQLQDLDAQALMEFLQTGNIYFNKTHFPGVSKIGYNERFEYRPNSEVKKHVKSVEFIDSRVEHKSLLASFRGYAHALSRIKISVDVTGGLDTRTLIAALHATDVDFETSVSGHSNHPDVLLGAKVAQAIDRPFHATAHNVSTLHSELEATVESLDGLRAHILTQHRLKQLQNERYDRGVTLTLKGLGGELYRDFIWLQDFPRYGSRKVNLDRLHRMRMEMVRFPGTLLTSDYRRHGEKSRAQRLARLRNYHRGTNTQSYDVVHCREFLQIAASRQLGSWAFGGNMAQAPLSEIFRLQHPYHQTCGQRFAGRYQKRFITECSVQLAKVQTTYGAKATSLLSDVPGDLIGLTANYSRTITRKLSQRYLNKTLFPIIPADHPDASNLFVSSSFVQRMVNVLMQRGILLPGTQARDIPERFLPNCVAAGHFLSRL